MYGHKKRYFEEDGNSKSSLNIKKQQKMPKSAKFIFENPNKTKWSVPIIFFTHVFGNDTWDRLNVIIYIQWNS